MKRQGGVVQFATLYLVDVSLGRHIVGVRIVVGDPTPGYNTTQIEPLAKFLPGIVEASAQAQVAVLRMHKHLDSVQHVALRIVGFEGIFACNFGVGMLVTKFIKLDNDRKRHGHDLPIHFHTDLSFGKFSQQRVDLILAPIFPADALVGFNHGGFQVFVVLFDEFSVYYDHIGFLVY